MLSADEIADRLARALNARPETIVAVYVFGSVARGTATEASDVDVAVLFRDDPPATLEGFHLGLERELERAVGHPLQLVVLNRAPCELVHRVLRDGMLVVDRDPSRRIRFEVRARNAYFDLKPYLDRYRQAPHATRR